MTAQAQAQPETTAASSSPKSNPAPAEPNPKATGVRPGITLGVRQPTPSTTPASGAASATGSATGDAARPSDPLDEESTTPSASSEHVADAVPLKLSSDEVRDVIRGLVMAGALGVHHLLARNPIEEELGLWLINEEKEAASIGDPLASIAKRHAGGLAFEADTGDLIKAGLAAAGYVAKNVVKAVQIRLALRRARRAGQTEPTEEHS